MDVIQCASQIDVDSLMSYLRITEATADDRATLSNLLEVAKAFTKSYTGVTDAGLDEHTDFVIVVLILVQDMWDNRTMYVDTQNLNFAVKTILDLHSVNLL